MENASQK